MKVAIPIFGDEVAPRFCFASEMIVVDTGCPDHPRHCVLQGSWSERIKTLSDLGVGVLLCSGFNRQLEPLARDMGLTVVWGLEGSATEIIADYVAGNIRPTGT
jgi:hypothetical protein